LARGLGRFPVLGWLSCLVDRLTSTVFLLNETVLNSPSV
jgi:hypothetical protein